MSIGVGTLQPKSRVMRPVWIGALVALVAAVTLAVVVANSDDEPVRVTTSTTQVSGTVNTPSELRGGLPTEFSGTTDVPEAVPHLPKRAPADDGPDALGGNTPSEIGARTDPCHQCT